MRYQPSGLKTVKQVKEFMVMIGFYRRFIPKINEISQPIIKLLKKNQPFIWTNEQQTAYETLKEQLTNQPLLKFPNFDKPFIISTDASHYAIEGNLHSLAYYSRGLNIHEIKYSVIEKETLAIIAAWKIFVHTFMVLNSWPFDRRKWY